MQSCLPIFWVSQALAEVSQESTQASKATTLTKRSLESLLEASSYRWQQTFAPIAEADAKEGQAEASNKVRLNGFAREFAIRTNELLLGIADTGPLDTLGGGITGLQVSYEVFNMASSARYEASKANQKLGRATSAQLQNDLRFMTQLRLLDTQHHRMKSKIADLLLAKDQELMRLASAKVRSGVGVPLDLARAEALVEKDNFKKIEAESNYEKSLQELHELVPGVPSNVQVDELTYREFPPEKVEIYAKKIEDRPELKVAELSVAAMTLMKKSTDHEVSPTINTFAEIGTAGTQAFGIVNTPTGSVGIQINIPIYNGGYNQAKSAEALSKLNSIEWQAKQIRVETDSRLRIVKSQLKSTTLVCKSAQRQVELAQKALGFAEKKISIGSSGNLDLVNAQSDLATALELQAQAIYAHEAAKLQFFHLLADLDSYLQISEERSPQ